MKMKYRMLIKSAGLIAILLMVLTIFMAGISWGADFYLKAEVFTYQNSNAADPYYSPVLAGIAMWGYANCTDGTFTTCNPASVPGPTLTVTEGNTLNIHVQNNLTGLYTEPTSVVIAGQTATMTPVWINPTTGAVVSTGSRLPGDVTSRVRSFTTETSVGGITTYTWPSVKAGTYLYQSGTHPSVQVQMGLYGSLIVNPVTAGRAYNDPSTAYDSQVILLFSEIDPALHDAISNNTYGPGKAMTSTVDYHPKYFLINGNPYWPGLAPLAVGNAGQTLLIRFLNAGLLEKTPTLQNQYMTLITEDGNLYPYSKQQYSLLLPAGKTADAIFTLPQAGYIPVFDRSLNLTNAAVSPGGDRVYLQVGAAQNTLSITKDGTGTGTVSAQSLPGGINCGTICSLAYVAGTEIRLVATPDRGSLLTAWSGGGCSGYGDCIVTLNADTAVTATFTSFKNITVLQPSKGEIIPAGSTYNAIRWGAPANAVTFKIKYSVNNGTTWTTIANGVVGNSYFWSVPVPPKTKPNCRIKVVGFNAKGIKIGEGNSARFTISVP